MVAEAENNVEQAKARVSRQAPYYLPAANPPPAYGPTIPGSLYNLQFQTQQHLVYAPAHSSYGHPPPYSPASYSPAPMLVPYEPEYYPSRNTDIVLDLSISPQRNNGGTSNSNSYGYGNANGNGNSVAPTSATLLQHFAPAPPPKKVIVPVPTYVSGPPSYYG